MNRYMINLIHQSSSCKSVLGLAFRSPDLFNDMYYGRLKMRVVNKRKKREKVIIISGLPKVSLLFFKDGNPERMTILENHFVGSTYSFFNDGNKASIFRFNRGGWEETTYFSSIDGKESVVKNIIREVNGVRSVIYRAPRETQKPKARSRRRYFGN
jgi:hypothetical protein